MRIYTKVQISMKTGKVLNSESYEYDGPVAECKGSTKTKTVQSPEARRALRAYMPALKRMGAFGAEGLPLWDTEQVPDWSLGEYPTQGYGAPAYPDVPAWQTPSAAGLMPSSANIGNIDPNIKAAVAAPYEEAMGQMVEKFGGGMGSARGGLSGAGGEVLMRGAERMIPAYTQQLWSMVQPGLQQEYGAEVAGRGQEYGARTAGMGAEYAGRLGGAQAGYQAQLARAAAASGLTVQQYQAQQSARAAPFQAMPAVVGGTMPQTFGSGTKK